MADKKITLKKLSELINDPSVSPEDLAPYFKADEDASTPFSPVLTIDPSKVTIGRDSGAATRSAMLLNTANWLAKTDRQARFYKLISSGTYTGPVIVSEGDSWFQYPVLLKDTIDVLMRDYAILSLGGGGDTLDDMIRTAEYRDALRTTEASILLLSGGGNDLVAGGALDKHLHRFDPALDPASYLKSSFNGVLDRAIVNYDKIFRDVARTFPRVQIICHGYDYTVPDNGKWLGKPMKSRGIKNKTLQKAIAHEMVNRFNVKLASHAAKFAHVHYIDMRDLVGDRRWHDELHPVNKGYSVVAEKFSDKIKELSAPRTRGGSARDGGPTSLSLHVGLNVTDPEHYGGLLSPLDACVADAEAMRELAQAKGFGNSVVLLDAKATRKNVIAEITKAAKKLKAGDIFFLSYAGHGGQIRDFNRDEPGGPDEDSLDETLCLYDAQLIDDELYRLWAEFAESVRVLTVFDCCHSGSMVRTQANRLAAPSRDDRAPRVRAVSLRASAKIFRNNTETYRGILEELNAATGGVTTRELDWPLSASVVQLSACQSNQLAEEDWSGNGLFTMRLLETLESGSFTGYEDFLDAISTRMPARQTPKFLQIGSEDPVFSAQSPFTI